MLHRVFAATVFGTMSIGQAISFAPDYGKAKLAIARVFALLDGKPSIDSLSEEGEKLVRHDLCYIHTFYMRLLYIHT